MILSLFIGVLLFIMAILIGQSDKSNFVKSGIAKKGPTVYVRVFLPKKMQYLFTKSFYYLCPYITARQ